LYELSGRDPEQVRHWQQSLASERRLEVPDPLRRQAGLDFASGWIDDATVEQTIRKVHREHGLLIDPHTAVAWEVGRRLREPGETLVTIAPAHPAKFGDVIRTAVGFDPSLPPELAGLMDRGERSIQIPNDYGALLELLLKV
jgi:threonine synthase